MSAPTEGRPYWDPKLGDLGLWYPTFEIYAATAPPDNGFFHGPHIAPPVDLDRVVDALTLLNEKSGDALRLNPLPSLDQMRAELSARSQAGNGVGRSDSGSPCHNFWHWIHGDS